MKRQTVSPAALRAMAVKNTKASARLEGREVPEGHVRSQAVEQYIAEHTSKTAGGCTSRLGPVPDTEAAEAFHPQTDSGSTSKLCCESICKAERTDRLSPTSCSPRSPLVSSASWNENPIPENFSSMSNRYGVLRSRLHIRRGGP